MKTNEIARKLGISTQAISVWIKEFSDFFTDGAKQAKSRTYTPDDLDVLATIAQASKIDGLGYDAIRVRLQSGEREHIESITLGVDTPMIAQSTAQALVDLSTMQAELEYMRAERDRLSTELQGKNELIDQLYKQVAELSGRAGQAEGRLGQIELLQRQIDDLKSQLDQERNKRRGWFG